MVERGWVLREVDPADRRRRTIRLTSEGRRVLEEAERALTVKLSGLLAGLSTTEVTALTEGLVATGVSWIAAGSGSSSLRVAEAAART